MGVVSVAALYHLGLNSWTAWAMLAGTGAYFWVGLYVRQTCNVAHAPQLTS